MRKEDGVVESDWTAQALGNDVAEVVGAIVDPTKTLSRRSLLRGTGSLLGVAALAQALPAAAADTAPAQGPEAEPIPGFISIPVVVGEDTIIESTTITETVTVGTVNSNNINYRLQPDTDEKVDDEEGNLVNNILGDLDREARVRVDTDTKPIENDNLFWTRIFVSKDETDPETGETIKVEQPAWMASGFLTQSTETTHTTQEKEIDTPIAGHEIAVTDLLSLYDLEQTGGSQLNLDIAKAYGIPVTTEGEGENTKLNNPVDTEVNTNAAIAYTRATYLAGMAVLTDPLGMGIYDAGRVDVGGSGDSSLYMYSQSFSKNGQTYVEVTSGVGSRFMVTRYKVEDVPSQGVEFARQKLMPERVSLESGADIYQRYSEVPSFAYGLSRIGDNSTFVATENGGLTLNPEAPAEIRDIVEDAVSSDAYRLYLANISSGGAYVEPPVSFKDLSQGEEIVIEQTESGRYEAKVVDVAGKILERKTYVSVGEEGMWTERGVALALRSQLEKYAGRNIYEAGTRIQQASQEAERGLQLQQRTDRNGVTFQAMETADGTPMMISYPDREGNPVWKEATLAEIADHADLTAGILLDGGKEGVIREFNLGTVPEGWSSVQQPDGTYNFGAPDYRIRNAKGLRPGMRFRISISADTLPNESDEDMTKFITTAMNHYKDMVGPDTEYVIYGEPPDVDRGGNNVSPRARLAFATARAANPDARLMYSETDNHRAAGGTVNSTIAHCNIPEVDICAEEAHLRHSNTPAPTRADATNTALRIQNATNKTVIASEIDVRMTGQPGSAAQVYEQQAKDYDNFIRGMLDAGVTSFTFWGLNDDENGGTWYRYSQNEPNPRATMWRGSFDDPQPNLSYYEVRRAFYDSLLGIL